MSLKSANQLFTQRPPKPTLNSSNWSATANPDGVPCLDSLDRATSMRSQASRGQPPPGHVAFGGPGWVIHSPASGDWRRPLEAWQLCFCTANRAAVPVRSKAAQAREATRWPRILPAAKCCRLCSPPGRLRCGARAQPRRLFSRTPTAFHVKAKGRLTRGAPWERSPQPPITPTGLHNHGLL
jgi:hypothetical protein